MAGEPWSVPFEVQAKGPAAHLTRRELEALAHYATAGSRKEAAHRMGIRPGTLRAHLLRAFAKLDAESASEAWTRVGWLRVPQSLL
jgi:DNA-binding CsgD family transcriptional regulator